MKPILRKGSLICAVSLLTWLVACNRNQTAAAKGQSVGLEEAVSTATDAYIYGYQLVTMDMTRKQMTNVAVANSGHAPMGQLVKMRTYPAVDYHAVTAPNADTLYTTAWLDVSREPWILTVPDMGNRYYLLPMLSGWTEVFQVPGKRTTGGKPQMYAQRMQQAYQAGKFSLNPSGGAANLVFTDYAQPGDRMTLTFDTAARKIRALRLRASR
jgi:hypothetical protein